jgi:hypothetical protein
MNTDDSTKNSLVPIKKWRNPVCNKNSPNKHNAESCNKNLGEFVFKAQCCSDNLPSDNSCYCDGRLLFVHVNLKNICPNKIIVVGVLVYEDDKLYAFKVKKMFTGYCCDCECKDLDAGRFCFILEENELCSQRKVRTEVVSHYVNF